MYQPPNTDAESFNKRLNTITSKFAVTNDKEVIIGMDHNLDLLKSSTHKHTQQFIEEMTEKTCFQQLLGLQELQTQVLH